MNILFGKYGKSIAFDRNKWGIHGGDAAPVILLTALAKAKPDDTFYIVARNDLKKISYKERLALFPNHNVINIWDNVKYYNKTDFTFVNSWFKSRNIHIDAGIFMSGPTGSISIPDTFYRIDKKGAAEKLIAKTMIFSEQYAGPIIYTINENDFPVINICEDPRYYPLLSRDLFRRPVTLGQYTDTKKVKHHVDYKEQNLVYTDVPVKYSYIETLFAMAETPYDSDELFKKKNKFMNLYLNQGLGAGGMDRGPVVNDWILEAFPDKNIKIHGKWKEPWCDMKQFTPTAMSDLIDEMESTKYTLIIPIKRGWVTSKFWKMLHFGILPFMHPVYDTQKHIPVDPFLRVETVDEFKDKLQYLEDNPEEYKKLYDKTMKLFRDNFYSGKKIIEEILNSLYREMGKEETFELKDDLDINISSLNLDKKIKPQESLF